MLPEKVPTSSWGARKTRSLSPHNNSKQSVKVVDFWLSREAATHMHVASSHDDDRVGAGTGMAWQGALLSITQLPHLGRVLRGLVNTVPRQ